MEAKISNPFLNISENTKAQIDTGADMTVIPEELARRLRLVRAGSAHLIGFDGQPVVKPTHLVNIELDGHSFEMVEVSYASDFLIGRDILNRLEVHLYGKNLTFEVADC